MTDYDVIVVGSGFGGSVAALRAAEKGYRVLVVEAGRRFRDEDFPKTSWDIRNYLWAPWLRCFGIQRISLLRNVMVLSGAGVGGGSLVYATTLYRPLAEFYRDQQWRHITDWRAELSPYYDQAERMLGAHPTHAPRKNATRTAAARQQTVAAPGGPTPARSDMELCVFGLAPRLRGATGRRRFRAGSSPRWDGWAVG